MGAYKYLYYQVYRLLSKIQINPNPKDNALYFLLIFEGLNIFTIHFILRETLASGFLFDIISNKIFAILVALVLWYLNITLIDFEEVDEKYKNSGGRGYLILTMYMIISLLCFFGVHYVFDHL